MRLTENQIKQVEKDINHLTEEVSRLFLLRDKSSLAWEDWSKACEAWHNYQSPTSFLWTKEFKASIKENDEMAVSEAILYLEVDPYYFRSGYLKERLLSLLKASKLSQRSKARILHCFGNNLRSALWRRDTRYYFSLIAKNFTKEFLENYINELNLPNTRKLRYLREYLKHYYSSNRAM